jgi:indole-3-glycerol phosphate synthase
MSDFLQEMKAHVLARVELMHVDNDAVMPEPIDFCNVFKHATSPVIISEVKLASPSRGVIYQGDLSPVQIAEEYRKFGANALSVLTEPTFFKGDIETIRQIRTKLPDCPILLKDFVLAPIQIKQARAYGASAVLLIVGFLEPSVLRELYDYAMSLGLTPLVEVHDADELSVALALNPRVIGINNRNLKTLKIDLDTSRQLIQRIPDPIYTVCESGIGSLKEMNAMVAKGFDGFLIGSHFMQTNHPGEALGELLKGGEHAG